VEQESCQKIGWRKVCGKSRYFRTESQPFFCSVRRAGFICQNGIHNELCDTAQSMSDIGLGKARGAIDLANRKEYNRFIAKNGFAFAAVRWMGGSRFGGVPHEGKNWNYIALQ